MYDEYYGCDSSSTFRQQALDCRDRVAGLYRDMGLQGDELEMCIRDRYRANP